MCDVANDGPCPVWNARERRARVAHKCTACPEPISPKDVYRVTSFLWEGKWGGFKHCMRCASLFDAAQRKANENPYDSLVVDQALDCGETWEQMYEEPPPPEVAALAFAIPSDFNEARL